MEQDKKKRIEQLKAQKRELNDQIKAIEAGDVPMLNKREVRERFIQFSRIAKELLGDFRMVEYNFRELDRNVRERTQLCLTELISIHPLEERRLS